MVDAVAGLTEAFTQAAESIIMFLPNVIGAIIIVAVGYFVGNIVSRAVNTLIDRTFERAFDKTETGRMFREAGIDLSDLIGALTKAYVIVLSVVAAVQVLNIGGTAGALIAEVANYLPRLIGGIAVTTLGLILASLLSSYIGKLLMGMFPKEQVEIAEMIKNLLLLGLVVLVLSVGLDIMQLGGEMIYTLILGVLIIAAGVFVGTTIVRNIVEDYPEFAPLAPYARFIIQFVFLLIGVSAIFANFPTTSQVIANLAWGVAIAFAIMLAPVVYQFTKKFAASAGS